MKPRSLLYSLALGIALTAGPALAGNRDFTLINDTRSTIDRIYVSTSDDNNWHATSGFKPLAPGDSAAIAFNTNDKSSACTLQLRVHFQNTGASIEWDDGFNFCQLHKIKVWYNYDNSVYRVTYN
jgi:hypothetical protein